jgi:hypothetical protein
MQGWRLLLVVCLSVQSAVGWAETVKTMPVPTTRQLRGLDAEQATELIAKLESAQRSLKGGEPQFFELLAGSLASYDMTKTPPRDVFLQVPFKEVWNIERVRTDNRLWQPYRLSYAPNGLGQLYWEIEVVLGINGDIQRVLMVYKPPAPF